MLSETPLAVTICTALTGSSHSQEPEASPARYSEHLLSTCCVLSWEQVVGERTVAPVLTLENSQVRETVMGTSRMQKIKREGETHYPSQQAACLATGH